MNDDLTHRPGKARLFLFDWDGTVADNWEGILKAKNDVRAAFGLNAIDIATYNRDYGSAPTRDIFLKMLTPLGRAHEIDTALALYDAVSARDHLALMKPLDGAADLIRALARDGHAIGVVSNKSRDLLDAQIRAMGLEREISIVLGAGDAGAGRDKPQPYPLWQAAEMLAPGTLDAATKAALQNTASIATPPDLRHVLLIGDSKTDVKAALAAGVTGILVHTPLAELGCPERPAAHFATMRDLSAALGITL